MNFLMSGATGRMGQTIAAMAVEDGIGKMAWGWANNASGDNLVSDIAKVNTSDVDIVIDFSLPEAFDSVLQWSVENGKPFFSGTTGISDAQKSAVRAAGEKIPALWSPNTSIGVNFLNGLLSHLGELESFDFQIVESHHIHKKDAPSGTALLLQNSLTDAVKVDVPEPLAIRGGGIFGEHEVMAMSKEEVITLKHTALTRSVFARGALRGAQWLSQKGPGHYSMKDVLGF